MSLQQNDPSRLRHQAAELLARDEADAALPLLFRALALEPDNTQTLNELGNALVNVRREEEGLWLLLRALELRPLEAKLHSNIGVALANLGRFEHALAAHATALRLDPSLVAAHINLGNLRVMMGQPAAALRHFEDALRIDPASVAAQRNRAIALLAVGDWERGLAHYEPRRHAPRVPPEHGLPWNGEPLAGKRILLVANQGIGDTIQFIRYAPLLKSLGAQIAVACPGLLGELLANVPGVDEWLWFGSEHGATFDFHVPLMLLPRFCGTTLASIPAASKPYLATDPALQEVWRQRLDLDTRTNIGIVWQGNPYHQWDRFRSMPLALFAPLANIPGIRLISLQRGPGIEQIAAFQQTNALLVPTGGTQDSPQDLADSAAIMSLLDLVITIDSAPAHLAAALGRPTWIMLALAADWRWLTDREDSPWYSCVKLFRQRTILQWEPAIESIAGKLRLLVTMAAKSRNPP